MRPEVNLAKRLSKNRLSETGELGTRNYEILGRRQRMAFVAGVGIQMSQATSTVRGSCRNQSLQK